ncbi:PaaI family thioesterase [Pseudophaeobacter sp.]|jgi:uncharacterized protein (TIGR00369 family)|uniref:PaaI family thioesterase n=1 Tax=Pseudophaeobacter sp. TaxID=1971739 RepID=UPI0032D8F1C9
MTHQTQIYGFGAHIGIQVDAMEAGEAQLSLVLQDHHRNFFGIVHGGVLLTLLDQTCGAALRSTRVDTGGAQGSVTIDLQTTFVAAARGNTLYAIGNCLRSGRSVAQCCARIEDADGTLVATATGTFKLLN